MHYLLLILDLVLRYSHNKEGNYSGALELHEEWYKVEFNALDRMNHWHVFAKWIEGQIRWNQGWKYWIEQKNLPHYEAISPGELYMWHVSSMILPFSLLADLLIYLVNGYYDWLNSVLPICIGLALSLLFVENEGKNALKKRRMDISRMLPEFLTLLSLYIHAGLTPYNAWKEAVETSACDGWSSTTIREMTGNSIFSGKERRLYSELSKKLKDVRMDRILSLMENSSVYGDHEFTMKLDRMKNEIRGEKIKLIRIKAEEAKVKLLVPMFINMIGVLSLIMIPIITALKGVFT